MATGAAVAVVGAAAITAYGKYEEGKTAAKNAKNKAASMEIEAAESLRRSKINAESSKREGGDAMSRQISSFISSGVEMEGTPLMVLEDTADKISRQVALDMESAEFDSEQTRRQAEYVRIGGKDAQRNANIAAVGALAMGGAKASGMGK